MEKGKQDDTPEQRSVSDVTVEMDEGEPPAYATIAPHNPRTRPLPNNEASIPQDEPSIRHGESSQTLPDPSKESHSDPKGKGRANTPLFGPIEPWTTTPVIIPESHRHGHANIEFKLSSDATLVLIVLANCVAAMGTVLLALVFVVLTVAFLCVLNLCVVEYLAAVSKSVYL
ncbi:hypothetical protein HDV01_000490 [Terramyces sp. JEL0728]|nr:hypothetical protein HDV01_000490 [Terramyces sp. JEL0728]